LRALTAAAVLDSYSRRRGVMGADCAVGGSSYFKRLPLERLFRDVRAGLYHPFDSDETLEFLGKSAFGIPLFDDRDTD